MTRFIETHITYTPIFPPPSVERRNLRQMNAATEDYSVARLCYNITGDPIYLDDMVDARDTLFMLRDLTFRTA